MEESMPILDDLSKGIKKGMDEAEKSLKDVGEKAEKGFKDVSEKAEKGFKEITEKASDAVKTFEIQQEIDKLEAEMKGVKLEIGDKALELFTKGTALDPALDDLAKKAMGVKAKIDGKKKMIEDLKND
jgi:ElaB/YqjD/DUF883 family membrane-anchored ribosome-binding protein